MAVVGELPACYHQGLDTYFSRDEIFSLDFFDFEPIMDNDGTKKDPTNEPQRRSYRLRKQSGADDCNPTKPKRLRDSGPQLIQIGDSGSLVTTVGTKETITTQTVTGDILSDQDIEGTSSSTYFLSQAASGKSLEGSDNNAPRVEFMSGMFSVAH